MTTRPRLHLAFTLAAALLSLPVLAQDRTLLGKPYHTLQTRQATRDAFLKQFSGVSATWGDWHVLAPIAHPKGAKDIATPYPPEELLKSMRAGSPEPDFSKPITLEGGKTLPWRPAKQEQDIGGLGGLRPIDLRAGVPEDQRTRVVGYLYRSIRVDTPTELPVSLGSDDGCRVWLNGELIVDANTETPLDPDAHHLTFSLQPGLNHLFVKVSQGGGEWEFQIAPHIDMDPNVEAALEYQLDSDFPDDESRFYRIVTIPVPRNIEAEVGGLDVLPTGDSRPILSTRRGDIYIVSHAYDTPALNTEWKRFATGLHEPLGLAVRPDTESSRGWAVFTVQRTELTKLVDMDFDDAADRFETFCNDWTVSGNYHEFAFGPKFDRNGDAWVTLNLAHTDTETVMGTTIPTRGWAVRITPDGVMHKVVDGLRSPDGIGMFSDGQMFYTDNQGDYVATNKLSPLFQDSFHGHQASLKFRDGWEHWKDDKKPVPEITPPAVWFPYQKMGQSASDILLDQSNGAFGPFSGQLFVGDQTHATVMRVFLEKLSGTSGKTVYQGACFPFRKGFESGVHRLCWGNAPPPNDHSMFVGMTDRGWGSVGPKRSGLQRLVYTGQVPFEIQEIHAKPDGFELRFTLPPTPATAADPASYHLISYTYLYRPQYGSPEVQSEDRTISRIETVSPTAFRLHVDQMKPGFVYEFDAPGVRNASAPLLHSHAYYTLNLVPQQ